MSKTNVITEGNDVKAIKATQTWTRRSPYPYIDINPSKYPVVVPTTAHLHLDRKRTVFCVRGFHLAVVHPPNATLLHRLLHVAPHLLQHASNSHAARRVTSLSIFPRLNIQTTQSHSFCWTHGLHNRSLHR